MKTSMIQVALLAVALGANAAPQNNAAHNSVTPQNNTRGVAPYSGNVARQFLSSFLNRRSSDDDDDDDDDKDEDEDSSSSSKDDDDDEDSSSSSKDDDEDDDSSSSSSSSKASSSKKTSSSSQATATSGSSSSAVSSSASTITSAASSGSSSSGSSGSLPASSGSSALSAVQTIAAGESFDGGMFMYDRGVDCTGQDEGGDSDAVFQIEAGGSLSNVIIGPNQIEGVHCQGACTLTNVWWSAVCEDAFTIKNQDAGDTTTITGGGAFGAEDKVMQHNGAGTLSISGFTVDTFGKLYRSCGNCDTMYERHVIMDTIDATDGSELAGINYNYGDSATLTNIVASGVDDICVTYTGTDDNNEEPSEYGSGADGTYCIYSDSDITSS